MRVWFGLGHPSKYKCVRLTRRVGTWRAALQPKVPSPSSKRRRGSRGPHATPPARVASQRTSPGVCLCPLLPMAHSVDGDEHVKVLSPSRHRHGLHSHSFTSFYSTRIYLDGFCFCPDTDRCSILLFDSAFAHSRRCLIALL